MKTENVTFYSRYPKEVDIYCERHAKGQQLQFESPLFTGMWGGQIENPLMNKIRLDGVKETARQLAPFDFNGLKLDVYLDDSRPTLHEYTFVYPGADRIVCFAYMRPVGDDGWENDSIWNSVEARGLYYLLFFEYFLPQKKFIQSSSNNSKLASDFWIKACKDALERGKTCSLINLESKTVIRITDADYLREHFSEIWGDDLQPIRIRINS